MIHNIDFSNYLPETLTTFPGFKAWVEILTWIWWCYAGFETCVGMGGEIKYPQINIPRALFLAPFVIFVVNALFQWFLAGLVPAASHSALAEAAAPYAEGLQMAGYMGFPIVLLCIGVAFGGDFSTMNLVLKHRPAISTRWDRMDACREYSENFTRNSVHRTSRF